MTVVRRISRHASWLVPELLTAALLGVGLLLALPQDLREQLADRVSGPVMVTFSNPARPAALWARYQDEVAS